MPEIVRLEPPVLVRLTFRGLLVVLTNWLPNAKLPGERATAGPESTGLHAGSNPSPSSVRPVPSAFMSQTVGVTTPELPSIPPAKTRWVPSGDQLGSPPKVS